LGGEKIKRGRGGLQADMTPILEVKMKKEHVTGSLKAGPAGFLLAIGLLLYSLPAVGRSSPLAPGADSKESVRKRLLERYADQLVEKGICDEKGVEIDARLEDLLRGAKAKGLKTDKQILAAVLQELNYSTSNLGGFPDCAFDRPIGHKLVRYGKTVAPGDIEAQAEGSACPVGGIGAGSYEWTMSGNFRYWFLKSGWMIDDTVWADQFHVFIKQDGKVVVQTLSTDAPPDGSLGSWKWNYPAGKGKYYALFPKSGFSYEDNEAFPVKLAVTQFSPIIAHNYRETSYPVAVYRWIAENPTGRPSSASC
jgi:hypothetical protein